VKLLTIGLEQGLWRFAWLRAVLFALSYTVTLVAGQVEIRL
jgi:hypothetical protein